MKPASLSAELRNANTVGYRVFLSHTVLRAALLLCLVPVARAESFSLPSAPTPVVHQHVFTATDWSLAAGILATRAQDWSTTEECLRRSYCREAELPNALVHNKVGFAAFELGMTGVSVYGQYLLIRHGHRKFARAAQAVDLGVMSFTIGRNYHLVTTSPVRHFTNVPGDRK